MTHALDSAVAVQTCSTPCGAPGAEDSPSTVNPSPAASTTAEGPAVSTPAEPPSPKVEHVRLFRLPLDSIHPSPENAKLYHPILPDDPEVVAMAESVRELGIRDALVVTSDSYILSGHRRHVAARLAGLETVPCRVEPFRRVDDLDRFVKLLREHNRQRHKSRDELLREAALDVDPDVAYRVLSESRNAKINGRLKGDRIEIRGVTRRRNISRAKAPMLSVIKGLVYEHINLWPLSVRMLHYMLLNDPPLRHASKPGSVYRNDRASYTAACDLIARARLFGLIPWEAVSDETRPVMTWNVWPHVQTFLADRLDNLFRDYWRDLQRSQPHYIEIVGEKNTLAGIIRPVASKFCVPYTLGRGYCSLDPRHEMAERYWASGKDKLVVLMASDFDPEGEDICHSFARSMRDDFGIENIVPVKVALTATQVKQHKLQPKMTAKQTSSRYRGFADKYGENVWEIEALPPVALQTILGEAIDSVLDTEAFNDEVDQEREDAAFLEGARQRVLSVFGEHDGEADDDLEDDDD